MIETVPLLSGYSCGLSRVVSHLEHYCKQFFYESGGIVALILVVHVCVCLKKESILLGKDR